MKKTSLKERILREMVRANPLEDEIFNELPMELQTPENLEKIKSKLRNLGETSPEELS